MNFTYLIWIPLQIGNWFAEKIIYIWPAIVVLIVSLVIWGVTSNIRWLWLNIAGVVLTLAWIYLTRVLETLLGH